MKFPRLFDFEFGLYNDNKITFHQWLFIKKEQITGSAFFPVSVMVTAIFLAVVIMFTWMDSREISEYDYRDVIDDQKEFGTKIPEYKVLLKEFYNDDGLITEAEYDDLQELILVYYREQARIEKLSTKAKVTKITNE